MPPEAGRTLRERLLSLATGANAEECPFNDPHTAAPHLWLLRRLDGARLECSCAPVAGDMRIRRRGGRKLVVVPNGSAPGTAPAHTRADPALVKALARAHRWKRLLEEGRYISLSETAAAERIDRGYFGRILRLTLLAPDLIEAILDGRHPPDLSLLALMAPFSAAWAEQRLGLLGGAGGQKKKSRRSSAHGNEAGDPAR